MTRTLWIIGLSVALLASVGFEILIVSALIMRKHLNLGGWSDLFWNAWVIWFVFGGLRSAIAFGDPTKGADQGSQELR